MMKDIYLDAVERWMKDHVKDYENPISINCMALTEAAADEFQLWEGTDSNYTIPEWLYAMADKVEEWYPAVARPRMPHEVEREHK
jgi:hypothetical protein